MKAAVWYEKGDIRVADIPSPEPGAGQVKVKIMACGICGSDLHEYIAGPLLIPGDLQPPANREAGPVVLGHEFSGEIVGVGQGVQRFKVGDRVTANPVLSCGECYYCKRGDYNTCHRSATVGFFRDGAFAEFVVLEERSLYQLPDSVTYDSGAFIEPLSVAVHAVNRSRMKIGDSVAVLGAGPIGLLVTGVCLSAGASQVFAIEPLKVRRELAEKLAVSAAIDPSEVDPRKAIAEMTNGLGVDIAFDCAGNQPAFDTAAKVTRRGGRICVAGISVKPIQVSFAVMLTREKEIIFSCGYIDEFTASIALLENKRVDVESLISARSKLDDFVEKGITPLIEDAAKYVKILVHP